MKEIQIFDAHCDTAILWYRNRIDFFNGTKGHATYNKLKKGNVKFQVFAICLNSAAGEFDPLRDILQNIKFFTQRIDANRKVRLIRTKQDLIEVNKDKNLMGAILGIEGGDLIRGSFEVAEILYSLGVRVFTPVWNYRNSIGTGMWEEDSDNGLTRFGKKLIPFLQKMGMIIDVSHAAKETFNDIVDCSIKPVIASHSNPKKICPHPRNLSDQQLKILQKNGSVIGVNFFPKFLTNTGKATRQDVIRHIKYLYNLVGPDSIGLGSDFDGILRTPAGLETAEQYQLLIRDLEKEGFDLKTIKKIAFKNWYNLFKKQM